MNEGVPKKLLGLKVVSAESLVVNFIGRWEGGQDHITKLKDHNLVKIMIIGRIG